MNLWARRLGLWLLAALVLFSCEEEKTIGLPQDNNLRIFFAEIPLKDYLSQVWVDDVNASNASNLIVGEHEDPEFGTIRSTAYTHILPPFGRSGFDLDETFTFVRAEMALRINTAYGAIEDEPLVEVGLYQLADIVEFDGDYTNSSTLPIDRKVGNASFNFFADSLDLQYSRSLGLDSTLFDGLDSSYIYQAHFELEPGSWAEIFDTYISFVKDEENVTLDSLGTAFSNATKGFALVSETPGVSLAYTGPPPSNEPPTSFSFVRFIYSDSSGETDSVTFVFNQGRSFNEISPNANSGWTNSRFSTINTFYEPTVLDDPNVYIQSGANLFASIDMSAFRNFSDTLPAITTVQNAVLFVNGDESLLDDSFRTPTLLNFLLTSDERLEESEFSVIPANEPYFINLRDGEIPIANRPYDNDSVNFISPTIYLKEVISRDTDLNRIIIKSFSDRELSRAIIPKDSIFLRIFYSTTN